MLLVAMLCTGMGSCTKNVTTPTDAPPVDTTTAVPADPYQGFTTYTMLQGAHYCVDNDYPIINGAQAIDFLVVFDSTCIYENVDPENQRDINKLMGFSDCNTLHQVNSARFGWNWMDGQLYLYAYCYNDGERIYKTLGTVDLNTLQHLKMYPEGNSYVFEVNEKRDTMPRHCSDNTITGYKLFPYFGGDEAAPHTVTIRIKYQ